VCEEKLLDLSGEMWAKSLWGNIRRTCNRLMHDYHLNLYNLSLSNLLVRAWLKSSGVGFLAERRIVESLPP